MMNYEKNIPHTLWLGDIHAGCQGAVAPPDVNLITGSNLNYSELQQQYYNHWLNCFEKFAEFLKGEKFNMVWMTELIQGTWSRFSNTYGGLPNQFRVFKALMDCYKSVMNEDQLVKTYCLRGSEAHAGLSQEYEELIAEILKDDYRIVPAQNRLTRQVLYLKMPNGALVEATHHFNHTNVYELTGLQREYKETLKEYGEINKPAPHVLVRGHCHRPNIYHLNDHPLTTFGVMITPGWQTKSTYVMKGLSRTKLTKIGMNWTTIEDNKLVPYGHIYTIRPEEKEVEIA